MAARRPRRATKQPPCQCSRRTHESTFFVVVCRGRRPRNSRLALNQGASDTPSRNDSPAEKASTLMNPTKLPLGPRRFREAEARLARKLHSDALESVATPTVTELGPSPPPARRDDHRRDPRRAHASGARNLRRRVAPVQKLQKLGTVGDILIVEDDAELAVTLADLLALRGHTTRVAFDGREGLRAMEDRLPDLILLDIEMPVLDGPGMAHAALTRDAGRELIPIILSSGYADIDAIAERIGTPYRIPKPCSLNALTKLVDLALTERRPPQPTPSRPPVGRERRQ